MKKLLLSFSLMFSLIGLSSCACWNEKKDSKECVVLKQVIDCSQDSLLATAPGLLPALMELIAAGNFNSDIVLSVVTKFGFKDAGCILTALESEFSKKASASPAMSSEKKEVSAALSKWKTENGVTGVQFKVK